MSEQAAPGPTGARRVRRAPIPHRPVIALALVLFLPDVLLVLDGNVSVQTALLRFAAALLISWCAARLVIATVRPSTRAAPPDAASPPATPPPVVPPPD